MQKKKIKRNKKIVNKRKVRNPSFKESEEKHKIHDSSSVWVGNISNISGKLNLASGNITTNEVTTGTRAAEINQLFDQLYTAIETNSKTSSANKEDLKAEVKEIQSIITEAAQKNEKADESFLTRRFRNIARMAPEVLDVVVKTLVNPALGIGEIARKIAEKAKEETKS